MNLVRRLQNLVASLERATSSQAASERQALLTGRLLAQAVRAKRRLGALREVEFSVFSQFGDDGIVQWMVHNLDLPQTFIEFGVEDYRESTTRFLLMNDNWSGFVMDSSAANVRAIVDSEYFWRYDLQAREAFVDVANVNELLRGSGLGEVGLLHIDLDGNDYWVWQAIDAVSPTLVILEYNSVYGVDRAIATPYAARFSRTAAHHSNLYWGASLRALHGLSADKGYAFVGCNSAGNNAYFVKRGCLNEAVREQTLEQGYVASRFRESRDRAGRLTHLAGAARLEAIRGLPVLNVETDQLERL